MNQFDDPEQFLDPELGVLLNLLRQTPARDPGAFARGRDRFLAEARNLLWPQKTKAFPQTFQGLFRALKEKFTMVTLKQRFAFTALLAVLGLTLFIFGGAGATALASQSALPGDALYPLKTSLEQTRVALARDAALQVQLHLRFAERRLDEITALISEGRFNDIDAATQEFENHIQQAIMALQTVANGDPQRAAELTTLISSALSRYAQTLGGLLGSVPPSVKPEVERAILASQQASQGEIEFTGKVESIAPEAWIVDGRTIQIAPGTEIKGVINVGDTVKVHAIMADDGSLIAREIELAGMDDEDDPFNQNENANQNKNENDNANENEERHGDEIRFSGVVEVISATQWTVSGRMLQITPQTEFRGIIQIGDMVEVRALQNPDGSLNALRLELEENENDNANINANQNTNTNANQNSNTNYNENENSNQNGNTNLNSNDNQNANENENSNSNRNTNDNGNENDNGNSNGNNNGNKNDD